ncbi:DUF2147 domain-containing protein [Noviherbaspirillum saxi]|uniref:DUF2147 domain-containing protein n=2 Tax=Noviherbaspirillum saxi TaxID=2320863 RepID=A0A3A3FTR8_9BURK|nr:DUF2147 domain-containing protein [Noviherbaspirillum saxi]
MIGYGIAIAALAGSAAWAQDASPVGLWKTIDDETGKPKSLVRITDNGGELRGRIEKLFPEAGAEPNPKCDKCEDARKDQPIVGMTIITGMKKDGNEYNGGQILDPGNGKVYKSKMSLNDGGKKLDVRGYIGVPMLGRTQTWVRAE